MDRKKVSLTGHDGHYAALRQRRVTRRIRFTDRDRLLTMSESYWREMDAILERFGCTYEADVAPTVLLQARQHFDRLPSGCSEVSFEDLVRLKAERCLPTLWRRSTLSVRSSNDR